MGTNEEGLLRAILATIARQTFSPEDIHAIVAPQANSAKWLKVYNACNGTLTQSEIAKQMKVDASDLSKKIKRWIAEGIVIRLADGKSDRPVHVYPIDTD